MSVQPTETLEKFGYPDTLLSESQHWVVLLHPKQVTAGCMVLAIKGDIRNMPDVAPEAYAELAAVTAGLEGALKETLNFDKINYLKLMMVDPQVHFHVIPRYASERTVAGVTFDDPGWPAQPDMSRAVELSEAQFRALGEALKRNWP